MTTSPLSYIAHLDDVLWPRHCVFIVDAALPQDATASLPQPRIDVQAGESLKTLERLGQLAEQVLALRSSRPLTLVAVGGGSLGDAVGFLASILWRGVELWHVPTTLVAMVDSAHGGKTAVNLGGRKNQLGTFYEAQQVVVCADFLDHLPLNLREEGLSELIKTLWLGAPDELTRFDDPDLLRTLVAAPIAEGGPHWQALITAAVETKYAIVAEDPQEQSGHRRILNLGHTAGHGLEAIYDLPHGRAIAWGLAACAHLSTRYAGLSQGQARRLLDHLAPLLTPLPRLPSPRDRRAFLECLQRDKKRVDRRLISILLDAPGQPIQTPKLTGDDWWEAVWTVADRWRRGTLRIQAPTSASTPTYDFPPGKSEANRAAMIAHLRPGQTNVALPDVSLPDDVVELQRALAALASAPADELTTIDAGNGGTTGRFLLAAAACRQGPTHIQFGDQLRQRPHRPLVDALTQGGAQIIPTAQGFRVIPWEIFPTRLTVDASQSSQFASALALLAARGESFTLAFEGPIASAPYFELTLLMLTDLGVEIDPRAPGCYSFSPAAALAEPRTVIIPRDASSMVVWHALAALHDHLAAPASRHTGHPDCSCADHVASIIAAGDGAVTLSLRDAPDLAPVLAALATRLDAALTITDAPHLRSKETDRIGELSAAFAEVGVTIEPRQDGLFVPAGVQTIADHPVFDPRGDHRLAMAALVLIPPGGALELLQARCVTKSYPDLWRHSQRAGFVVAPPDRSATGYLQTWP